MTRGERRATETSCPRCDARVTVRLAPDEVCPECESTEAWTRYGHDGRRLRIDRAAIDESVARRAVRRLPLARRAVPCFVAFLLGLAALMAMRGVLRWRDVGPIDEVLASVMQAARWSFWLGIAAFASGSTLR